MSGINIQLTPLLGALSATPLCYLLDIDGFCFLLDCGWDESFDEAQLDTLRSQLHRVDAVLLSHPDLAHLGALPYLVGRCGLAAPIYSTAPVHKMGEMFMWDAYLSQLASSDFKLFDLSDIDAAFAATEWKELRFLQQFALQDAGEGLTLTPYQAGHSIGGSVWRISKGGRHIVYAVDYCHRKERLLNGTTIHELFNRPALMITDSWNVLSPPVNSVKRDADLFGVIQATLRGHGSVLLPVDAAARVMELALLLDAFWAERRLQQPLVFLSPMGRNTVDFAKSQLEWMSDVIGKAFEAKRSNPFNFRCLKLCCSMEELQHLPQGPKVVLATSANCEVGFARQLLADWASNPANSIIFTERAQAGTLADVLQRHPHGPEPLQLQLQLVKRVPLEGDELQAHLAGTVAGEGGIAGGAGEDGMDMKEAALVGAAETDAAVAQQNDEDQEMEALYASAVPRTPRFLRSSSSSLSRLVRDPATGLMVQRVAAEEQALPAGITGHSLHLGAAQHSGSTGGSSITVLLDGFKPPPQAQHPMFPDESEAVEQEWDDYGAVVKHSDYALDDLRLPPPGPGSGGAMEVDGVIAGSGGEEVEEAAEEVEVPTKLISMEVELAVRAAVRFFDYEGRADGRTITRFLSSIAPRQLVLVHGTEAATNQLAAWLRHELSDYKTAVQTPGMGEAVDLTLTPAAMTCLSDDLFKGTQLHAMQQYAVAWLDGVLAAPEPHLPNVLQLRPTPEAVAAAAAAEAAAASGTVRIPPPSSSGGIFVARGELGVTLSDIKAALSAAGMDCQFVPGGLVCGNITLARGKVDKAHILLEGCLGPEYYAVRDVVYGQFGLC